MKATTLHPKIREFKRYMKGRPDLQKMVRQRKRTLQSLFEQWHRNGGKIQMKKKKKTSKKTGKKKTETGDLTAKLMELAASFDISQWERYVASVQSALEFLQFILSHAPTQDTSVPASYQEEEEFNTEDLQ